MTDTGRLRLVKETPNDPPQPEIDRIVGEVASRTETQAAAAVSATPSSLPTTRPPHADQSVVSTLDAEQEEKAQLIPARERALVALNHLLELCPIVQDSADQDPVTRMWAALAAASIPFSRRRLGRTHQLCTYWQEAGGTVPDFEKAGTYFSDLGEKLLIAQEGPPAPVRAPNQSTIATVDIEKEGDVVPDSSQPSLKDKMMKRKLNLSVSTHEAVDKAGDDARAAAGKAALRTQDDIPASNGWMNETVFGDNDKRTGFDSSPPSQPPGTGVSPPFISMRTLLGIVIAVIAVVIALIVLLKPSPPQETVVTAEDGTKKTVTSGRFPMTSTHLGVVNGAWPGASGNVTCWKPLLKQVADDTKASVDCADPNNAKKSRAIRKHASDGTLCYDVTACEVVIP